MTDITAKYIIITLRPAFFENLDYEPATVKIRAGGEKIKIYIFFFSSVSMSMYKDPWENKAHLKKKTENANFFSRPQGQNPGEEGL